MKGGLRQKVCLSNDAANLNTAIKRVGNKQKHFIFQMSKVAISNLFDAKIYI